MGIFDKLKKLISRTTAVPAEQVPIRAVPPAAEFSFQEVIAMEPAPQEQPQTSSQQTAQTWPNGDARTLLKEATALKRAKRYDEAVAMLRRAYQAPTEYPMMIEERLRLPMYLQLAGRNDEGWDELNRLNVGYVDQFSQPIIANQMRVFLQKENNETAANPVRVILRGDNKPQEVVSEPRSVTMAALQNAPMPTWMADGWIGFRFSATMQLRTPLRVLLRHGELYLKNDGQQPKIAREPWEGMWVPVGKSFEEIARASNSSANDIEVFRRLDAQISRMTMASDVGPILAEDYLPFLIAVRRIVEAYDSIEQRIEKLREMPMTPDWEEFVSKHRGIDGIIQCFFPKFINLAAGLDTPNRIAAASDETLLAIKGIGYSGPT
jgi:hypothetical protein